MSDLIFNPKFPIVLIDNSYYIFYRYFATLCWFRKQNDEIDHANIMNNKEFIVAFFKHFEADVKKITKKYKTVKDNIIFCIDCPRSNIWRNDIYDKYKKSRLKKDNFNSDIFTLFEDYLKNNNFINKIKYNPNVELLYKIIIGDKSDNICKIQNGMKKNTALTIALMTEEDRNNYLISNNAMDAFNLNKRLIDFREIPEIIVQKFYDYYNISINYG